MATARDSRGHLMIIGNETKIEKKKVDFNPRKGYKDEERNVRRVFEEIFGLQYYEHSFCFNATVEQISTERPHWNHKDPNNDCIQCKIKSIGEQSSPNQPNILAGLDNNTSTLQTHGYPDTYRETSERSCPTGQSVEPVDGQSRPVFVLAIMTHGVSENGSTHLKFTDGKTVPICDIINSLNDENVPWLRNRVRLIMIQACRGRKRDSGTTVSVLVDRHTEGQEGGGSGELGQEDGGDEGSDSDGSDADAEPTEISIHQETQEGFAAVDVPENFIVVFSTTPGFKAYTRGTKGSWMFLAMKTLLDGEFKDENEINFLKLMTNVAGIVAGNESVIHKYEQNVERDEKGKKVKKTRKLDELDPEKSGKKSCVQIVHRLTEPLIFRRNVPKSDISGTDGDGKNSSDIDDDFIDKI